MFVQTEFDQHLVDMLRSTCAPGQYAARNAIRHLDRAAATAETDPDMAAFRAITAEEESATAVFHALRRHEYPGWQSLKVRDHLQKNALSLFCAAVTELFARVDQLLALTPQLEIQGDGDARRLGIRFHVRNLGLGDRLAYPQPPLHWHITENGALHDFSTQLEEIAASAKFESIRSHLQRRANARNQILYAWPDGLPQVKFEEGFLVEQRRRVKVHIVLFLMIDSYPEHQLLIAQGLRGFLKMIDALPVDLEF